MSKYDRTCKLQANVNEEDYNYLFRYVLPLHGTQTEIVRGLFETFAEAVRNHPLIEPHYHPDNEHHIRDLLRRVTVDIPDRATASRNVRRTAGELREELPGTSSGSAGEDSQCAQQHPSETSGRETTSEGLAG